VGEGLHVIEAARSHWASDHPYLETSALQHNTDERQTSMSPTVFEPAIPAVERRQTHALHGAAIGIGVLQH
jgi:hypothetical protein